MSFWRAVEKASLPPSLHGLKGSRDLGLGSWVVISKFSREPHTNHNPLKSVAEDTQASNETSRIHVPGHWGLQVQEQAWSVCVCGGWAASRTVATEDKSTHLTNGSAWGLWGPRLVNRGL